jgi:FkbM family methyltransferase
MSIPKVVHFTVSENPSPNQLQNIKECREKMGNYEVRVWEDPLSPDKFRLSKYWNKTNSGAQLADLIRLEVVYKYGGIYLDSDITVHKKFDNLLDEKFFIASEDGKKLTNAVFGAEKESPILKRLIDTLLEDEPDWTEIPVETTGPKFLARNLKWEEDVTVLPKDAFYTYNWNEEKRASHPAAHATHRWKGSWVKEDTNETEDVNNKISFKEKAISYAEKFFSRVLPKHGDKENSKTYPASGVLCVETIHGYRILLPGEDVSVTPQVVHHGFYELEEERFIKEVLRGGDFFVDVGANVGTFSLLAAKCVGPFGRVFAFEPNPSVAKLLEQSAVMNWYHDRLVVNQVAIAEDAYTSSLVFADSRLGDSKLGDTLDSESTHAKTIEYVDQSDRIEVPVKTLDQIFPYNIPIRFLKIDVEGLEHLVVEGAKRLISRKCIDYIMVETVKEVAGENWGEVVQSIEELTRMGYSAHTFSGGSKPVEVDLKDIKKGSLHTRNVLLVADWVQD